MNGHEVIAGRQLTATLPRDDDIITAVKALCHGAGIQQARFNIMGAVSKVTLGTYDQTQQVFVTATEQQPYEMLYCSGNVIPKGDKPFVFAKICLADEQGHTLGGHLFSETLIYYAEIELLELKAPVMERQYEPGTGLTERRFY